MRLDSDTIARWESDRQSQTAAIDVLLRLVRDVPGNIEYLRARAV
jgi:DNA-binding transcriptional regulator YiaG